jgi:RimJ/RimL family protein N-acetyltransferase
MSYLRPTPIYVPELETERLRLRGPRAEDFPHSATMWTDPAVVRYTTKKSLSREECWTRFLRYIGHWSLLGFGYWFVEEKATGSFIGEIGFADYKRDIVPSLEGMPEIGWMLASSAHGKGLGTEAVRAALTWGDVHFSSARTSCIIVPENVASVRLALKCGYRELQKTTYKGDPVMLFVRDRMTPA